jgi:hypothetical protein
VGFGRLSGRLGRRGWREVKNAKTNPKAKTALADIGLTPVYRAPKNAVRPANITGLLAVSLRPQYVSWRVPSSNCQREHPTTDRRNIKRRADHGFGQR